MQIGNLHASPLRISPQIGKLHSEDRPSSGPPAVSRPPPAQVLLATRWSRALGLEPAPAPQGWLAAAAVALAVAIHAAATDGARTRELSWPRERPGQEQSALEVGLLGRGPLFSLDRRTIDAIDTHVCPKQQGRGAGWVSLATVHLHARPVLLVLALLAVQDLRAQRAGRGRPDEVPGASSRCDSPSPGF